MAVQLVGRTFEADLGQLQARSTYESDTRMTFVVTSGAGMTTDGDGDHVIAHSRVSGWITDGDAAIVDIFRRGRWHRRAPGRRPAVRRGGPDRQRQPDGLTEPDPERTS